MTRADFKAKALYSALDAQRSARRMSWENLAQALHVSAETFRELPEREVIETDGVLQMTRWLGLNIESFVGDGKDAMPGPDPGDWRSSRRFLRFDTKSLYEAVDAKRRAQGLSWQGASDEIGALRATAPMLMHLKKGGRIDLYSMLAIVAWLGEHTAKFTRLMTT